MNTDISTDILGDIAFVKTILPEHYTVQESKKKGSIHCKSAIGIRKSPYKVRPYSDNPGKVITITDAEDDEHWGYIFQAIKQHFGERFQEVFHNTCFCHVDFTIYLKPTAMNTDNKAEILKVWNTAITYANNLCVHISDGYNYDDCLKEANAAAECAKIIRAKHLIESGSP
jgi:hypothetical protein